MALREKLDSTTLPENLRDELAMIDQLEGRYRVTRMRMRYENPDKPTMSPNMTFVKKITHPDFRAKSFSL